MSDIKFKDTAQLPSKFRIKSEMMLEMEKIEPQIFQVKTQEENEKDNDDEPKLTREELIQRSRELRQLRMKESQRSIKSHHQNKIKSKKYHRILKKEKLKQQIKEFEILQKTDPEAALRKIEQLDRSRIEERGLLRHRNTGTWAQNLQVRAKYDKDARKDLAEQIAISREMTAKKKIDESDSDDDDDKAQAANASNDDPFNPWLKVGKSNENSGNEIGEFLSGYRKYWQVRNEKQKELTDYNTNDGNEKENENCAQDNEAKSKENEWNVSVSSKISKCDKIKPKMGKKSKLNAGWIEEDISETSKTISKKKKKEKFNKKQKKKAEIMENIDDLFDNAEDVMREKGKKN